MARAAGRAAPSAHLLPGHLHHPGRTARALSPKAAALLRDADARERRCLARRGTPAALSGRRAWTARRAAYLVAAASLSSTRALPCARRRTPRRWNSLLPQRRRVSSAG